MATFESTVINSFPNPARDRLTVETSIKASKLIKLYDARGQLLKTLETIDEQSVFNVSAYEPGLYLIAVYQHGKAVGAAKVILIK